MKKNRKGFTLAELLIVVAIIGVLVAVSIPIFTSQLEKSREATDLANIRAAKALAVAAYYDLETGGVGTSNVDGLEPGNGDKKWYEAYYSPAEGKFVGRNSLNGNVRKGAEGKGTTIDTGNTYTNYNPAGDYTEASIYVEIMMDKSSSNILPNWGFTRGKGILIHWRRSYQSNLLLEDLGYEWIPLE